MILLRMLAFQPFDQQVAEANEPKNVPMNAPRTSAKSAAVDAALSPALNSQPSVTQYDWNSIIKELSISAITRQLAENCVLQSTQDNCIELLLAPHVVTLKTEAAERTLSNALENYFGKKLKLKISVGNQPQASPALLRRQDQKQKQDAARDSIINDEFVNKIIEKFDGQITPNSIKPID
jgi:DNA polymerase-3 subunit gamma/tau